MRSLLTRKAPMATLLLAMSVATTAVAGLNPDATLPLHAAASSSEPCTGYLPVDCGFVSPTVNIAPGPTAIFLLVNNYTQLVGVQTAFVPDASWTFSFGLWDCQPGQLSAVTPGPPFGATSGTITTAFNCLDGPSLAVIGRMFFIAGATGCLEQVQSSYPFGIHVVDCAQGIDQVPEHPQYRGRICVGSGGIDACYGPQPAVGPVSWGQVKAQYD